VLHQGHAFCWCIHQEKGYEEHPRMQQNTEHHIYGLGGSGGWGLQHCKCIRMHVRSILTIFFFYYHDHPRPAIDKQSACGIQV
jgi:hypothetical protein